MCGVVGAMSVANLTYNMEKWFRDALYVDGLRGMDSTGVMSVSPKYEVSVNKKAMNPADFMDLKSTGNLLKTNHRVLLGHNRWATKGAINNANAHPFTHEHITMVHNGSLLSYYSLKDHTKFTVDSEAIAYSIAHDGAEETIKKLNGSFSLVWWDDDAKTMNFCRNDERPMYLSAVEGGKKIVFASEPEMITWLAGGEHTRNSKFKHEEPKQTEVGVLYTFDIGANEKGGRDLIAMTSKRVDLFTSTTRYSSNQGRGGWDKSSRRSLAQKREDKRNNVTPIKGGKRNGQPVAEKLKQFGLNRGDEVEFSYIDHSVVGTTNKMIVVGTMPTYPFLPIKAYNLNQTPYEFNERLTGKVVSIIINANEPHPSIILSDVQKIKPFVPDTFLEHLIEGDGEEDTKVYKGFNGRLLTEQEFNTLTKSGCAQCQCDLEAKDHEDHEWLDTNTVLCDECEIERQRFGSLCFPNI